MPNGKMSSEQRSKIFSLYLRAWALVEKDATVEVPFITDLTLTASQWTSKQEAFRKSQIQAGGKKDPTRCADGPNPVHLEIFQEPMAHTFRAAWKDYLTRVPPASFRQTRNFMMAVIAEGRNYDRDDTLADAKTRGSPVLCTLSVHDISTLQDKPRTQCKTSQDASTNQNENENTAADRLQKTMASAIAAARRVVDSQREAPMHAVSETAEKRNLRLADFKQDHKEEVTQVQRASTVETYRSDYKNAYAKWRKDVFASDKTPNAQQWQVLNLIHERCVYEHREESLDCVNATVGNAAWEPLFRLVHSLPGSGKSQLIK